MNIAQRLAKAGGGSFGNLDKVEERSRNEAEERSRVLDATGRARHASSIPIELIVFNPLNPRKTLNEDTIDELAASLSRGQIVPITVVSREAFLEAHPDQAEAIGDAAFVALDGNRRLKAARRAGLKTLRVDLNDALVATAAGMVEAALTANVQREDVLPFEEAQAIEQLLATVYNGNQAAVARKLGKSSAWVGQRLALLHLTPELQEQASTGGLNVEDARKIGARARAGKLTPAEQLQEAEAAKQAAAEKEAAKAAAKADRAAARKAGKAAAPAPDVNAVYASDSATPAGDAPSSAPTADVNAVYTDAAVSPSAPPHAAPGAPLPGGPADVNGVYPASVPEQREELLETVTLNLDTTNFVKAAQMVRSSFGMRPSVHLAAALLAILQEEPEFHEIMQEIRGRAS